MNGTETIEAPQPSEEITSIISRINELGLRMGVVDGELVLEGALGLLSLSEREAVAWFKSDLIAYLSAPREHVAILCKHRQPDGRACGDIVTYQRPSGKVAWCQTCYGENRAGTHSAANNLDTTEPCYCCKHTDWWISIYGNRICRVCHPPAYRELEDMDGAAATQAAEHDSDANPDAESIVPNPEHVVLPLRRPKAKQRAKAPAMYVAKDLKHWITKEPYIWADKVSIDGKEFVRVTPEVIAWLKGQITKAEVSCNGGKLSVGELTQIVRAFCPVYEFAVRAGMVPDPVPQKELNAVTVTSEQ